MKATVKTLIFVLTIALIASCSSEKKKENSEESTTKAPEKVKVSGVEKQNVQNTFEYTSTLIPFEEVYYAPATPGRIEKINVEVGSRFRKGDLLVIMDQTQLQQARIQFAGLEADKARYDTLIKTGSIPKQQYDQFMIQYDITKSNVQFLEKNSRLHAPFSGIVSGKYYQNGEMFSGAPNTPVGKAAVVSIVQIQPLKAVVNITERNYPLIKAGMNVQILSDIYPDMPVQAKVLRVYPTIDAISRTFQVEITVPNIGEKLRPGMFCRATFDIGTTDVLLVPSNSVLKLQGSNERYLYVAENGKAKRVTIQTGRRFDDKFEIVSGDLNEGDMVIVSGQSRLSDGDAIQIIE